jgi:hypothetical protein
MQKFHFVRHPALETMKIVVAKMEGGDLLAHGNGKEGNR